MLLDDAVTCPWVAFDSETHRNALVIDVDHDDALDRWLALPEQVRPMLCLDPWTGRAHAVAMLAEPVLLRTRREIEAGRQGAAGNLKPEDRARLGPQAMADLAGRLLAAAFGGTLLPPGSLAKNPWGLTENLIGTRRKLGPRPVFAEHWERIQGLGLMWAAMPGTGHLALRDIIAALAPMYWLETSAPAQRFAKRRGKRRPEPSALGRNCALFDLVRFWAYDRAEKDGGLIHAEADRVNAAFADPLPASEAATTARSITKFMNSRFRPRKAVAAPGRDAEAGAGLEPQARKVLAGRRTAEGRTDKTDALITQAVRTVQTAGQPLTQPAIVRAVLEAGGKVSLRTVKRRWNLTVQKVPFASLSGNAPLTEPSGNPIGFRETRGNQDASSRRKLLGTGESEGTLAGIARRDRVIRHTVAKLAVVTRASKRPGAKPPALPAIPHEVACVPEIAHARREAENAVRDARRRAAARDARRAAQDRAADFLAWAAEGEGWRRWRAFLADLEAEWDVREQEAEGDAWRLAAVRRRREAVFGACWRQWRHAQHAVFLEREAEIMAAIPW